METSRAERKFPISSAEAGNMSRAQARRDQSLVRWNLTCGRHWHYSPAPKAFIGQACFIAIENNKRCPEPLKELKQR